MAMLGRMGHFTREGKRQLANLTVDYGDGETREEYHENAM